MASGINTRAALVHGALLCKDNNAAPGELACGTNLDCAKYPGTPFCNAQTGMCQREPAPRPAPFFFRPYPHTDEHKEWVFDPFRQRHYPRESLHGTVIGYTKSYT